MTDIDEIMDMLDWNNDIKIQNDGLEKAKKVKCLRVFFQPLDKLYNKNVWENCAKVIYSKSDEEISSYLADMFEWLQDMNWPGAKIIAKRLSEYNDKEWLEYIKNECLIISRAIEDTSWEEHLNNYENYIC